LYQRKEEPIGLNHFGFHVKSNEEMQIRAEKAGVRRGAARPDRIPFAEYRVHDPEGDCVDISKRGACVDPLLKIKTVQTFLSRFKQLKHLERLVFFD
jgi:hypothetical protein